jgi:hypothetical protein
MSDRIFLCYANAEPLEKGSDAQQIHLKHLKAEYKNVREIFKPLEDNETIRFDSKWGIKNREEIKYQLTDQYCKDLLIFGFSGHASGKNFMFEEEHIRSEGLAKILNQYRCPYLKLVFLNGCLTQKSVSFFEQAEVPIIISTNSFMEDRNATLFASTFFKELVVEAKTLFSAYKSALQIVELDKQISGPSLRCYKKKRSDPLLKQAPSWELAYREEVCLDWKLALGKELPAIAKSLLEDIVNSLSNLEPYFSLGTATLVHCDKLVSIMQNLDALTKQSETSDLGSYRIENWVYDTHENLSLYLEASSSDNQWLKDGTGKEIAKGITSIKDYISERVNI